MSDHRRLPPPPYHQHHQHQHHHHQRSSSTGSHSLFFSPHLVPLPSGPPPLNVGVNPAAVAASGLVVPPDTSGSLSDDDEDGSWADRNSSLEATELQGTLSKWTNYIHGWQDRFIALKEGSLVYYKSECETDFGCRGAILIDKATVKPHEIDDLRFDVSVSDCVWYLRAVSVEDRRKWIDAIETQKRVMLELSALDGGGGGGVGSAASYLLFNSLRRHDSAMSLTSTASKNAAGGPNNIPAAAAASSTARLHQNYRGLNEKLAEMETFRDILCRQIDALQAYFDATSSLSSSSSSQGPAGKSTVNGRQQHHGYAPDSDSSNDDDEVDAASNSGDDRSGRIVGTKLGAKDKSLKPSTLDFRGEAITFKATTAGILATMSHCIDIMSQREEHWRKKLEREQLAKKVLEEKLKLMTAISEEAKAEQQQQQAAAAIKAMPKTAAGAANQDFDDGPKSQIGEDEFFDAVESALDKLQEEQDYRDKLKKMSKIVENNIPAEVSEAKKHPLWPTIDSVTKEQLHYARLEVGEGVWELFAEDGDMKLYKREEEVDGLVMDPLKALHQVRGVTAKELCHYFFAPEVRMEWETTVDQATVLEKIAPDTLIFLQLHKRVWPAAQRDALFWSHMRHYGRDPSLQNPKGAETDTWMVCNKSTKHPDAPENEGGCLRVGLIVCFVCDTFIDPPFTKETARRSDVSTKITYCSVVNPGGWAPASVLRTIFKREYPKFLKRFTEYVIDKTKGNPLSW